MSSHQPEGFDLESALEVTGGDRELLEELAQLFIRECPSMMADLESAIMRGDAKQIEMAAHKLKGAVTAFGGRAIAATALRIETLGKQGELTDIDQVWTALRKLVSPFLAELRSLAGQQFPQ